MAESKKDKNKEKSLVEVAKELGGVIVYERPCHKNYECENCKVERCNNK